MKIKVNSYETIKRTVKWILPFYLFTFLPLTALAQEKLTVIETGDSIGRLLAPLDSLALADAKELVARRLMELTEGE